MSTPRQRAVWSLILLAVIGVTVASGGSLATAGSHETNTIREPRLHVSSLALNGRVNTISTTQPSGPGECVTGDGTGPGYFPRMKDPRRPDGQLRFVVDAESRPHQKFLAGWSEVDEDRYAIGTSEDIALHIRGRNGRGDWVLTAPAVESEQYLRLVVRWKDSDGCGNDEHVDYLFSVPKVGE